MTPQTDELDRLIDALNAGDTPAVDALADPELAGLLNAVTRIRSLREVNLPVADSPDDDWPERAVRGLARDLRQPRVLDVLHVPTQAVAEERPPDDKTSDPTLVSMDRVRHQSTGRRRLPRELAQMAAAIVVLVLVAGSLAVLFRGQSENNQVGIGEGATSTGATSAQLPMSITAGGITVTLQMVDSASSATRLHVSIALPAYAIGQPASFILGQVPADNIQLEGMNVSANDLHATEHNTTTSNDILFLDYPAPFPTERTVTLTIKQLWLPAKPTSSSATPSDLARPTLVSAHMQAVTGPWTFHITPKMVAAQPLPTPDNNWYCLDEGTISTPKLDCYPPMSVPLAQKLVKFPIIEPTPLPASLSRDAFGVSVLRFGTSGSNQPNYVSLDYWLRSSSGQQDVVLVQTTNHAAVPTINGTVASIVTSLSSGGRAQTMPIRPGTLATLTIDGVNVTRFAVGPSTTGTTYFTWTQAGVSYSIEYTVHPPSPKPLVTDAELQQMVKSIMEQRAE